MPFLFRRVWFLPKLSYQRITRLVIYLPIFFFSFYQKINLHFYKRAWLSSSLFTIFTLRFLRAFIILLYICPFCIFVFIKKQICICINMPGCHCHCLTSKHLQRVTLQTCPEARTRPDGWEPVV